MKMTSRICFSVFSFSNHQRSICLLREPLVKLVQRNNSQSTSHNARSPDVKDPVVKSSKVDSSSQTYPDEDIQDQILRASLPFVNAYGWSKSAIAAGAESVGYPGIVHGMFPRGGANLVEYFYSSCNKELALKMQEETEAAVTENRQKDPQKFVADAIEVRLRMIVPYLSTWPEALAIMALPSNTSYSITNLMTLAYDICYYCGDPSVDAKWYVKRLGVGSIYKATELYFLQDNSFDHQNTWRFLNSRIGDAMQLHSLLTKSESRSSALEKHAAYVTTTVINRLRLNWNTFPSIPPFCYHYAEMNGKG